MTAQTPTKVIFKRFQGDVIALFPALPGTHDPYATCLSYQTIGQHGSASMGLFALPPADPAEYAPLMSELESIGYTLRIAHRATRQDLNARKRAL